MRKKGLEARSGSEAKDTKEGQAQAGLRNAERKERFRWNAKEGTPKSC